MIFAAGEGRRMRPLTLDCPKPLLSVAGRPLLAWHLDRLVAAGVQRVVINLHYLADQLRQWVKQSAPVELEIVFSEEAQLLETGGGLLQALPLLDSAPFWLINGDIWLDSLPIAPQLEAEELGRLWLVPNPPHHPEGDFILSGTRQRATFSGCSLLKPELLSTAQLEAAFGHTPQGAFKLAPLLHKALEQGRLNTALYTQGWMDVGTPERLEALRAHLAEATQ